MSLLAASTSELRAALWVGFGLHFDARDPRNVRGHTSCNPSGDGGYVEVPSARACAATLREIAQELDRRFSAPETPGGDPNPIEGSARTSCSMGVLTGEPKDFGVSVEGVVKHGGQAA